MYGVEEQMLAHAAQPRLSAAGQGQQDWSPRVFWKITRWPGVAMGCTAGRQEPCRRGGGWTRTGCDKVRRILKWAEGTR